MKYLLEPIRKPTRNLALVAGLLCTLSSWGIQVPDRPRPERLVNDMAQMLSPDETRALEQNLVEFSRITSYNVCYTKLLRKRNVWPVL